jgi:hypothetical protein
VTPAFGGDCGSRRRASILTFIISAAAAGAATLSLGASAQAQGTQVSDTIVITVTASPGFPAMQPPIPLKPRVSPSPTPVVSDFADQSPGGSACPARPSLTSSATTTAFPSVSPTVQGITFVNPPPSGTRPPRLPFTGLPLASLLAMAAALVGTGALLMRSKRRHHLGRH